MKEIIEIFLHDLTEQKRAEVIEALGDDGNYDTYPVAVITVENDEDKVEDEFINEDFNDVLGGEEFLDYRHELDELETCGRDDSLQQLLTAAAKKAVGKYCKKHNIAVLQFQYESTADGARFEQTGSDCHYDTTFFIRENGKVRCLTVTWDEIYDNCYQIEDVANYFYKKITD